MSKKLPKQPPPGTVRVRVRTRGNGPPIGWAGEVWDSEWREFDAYPIHIEDFRKDHGGRLVVEYPKGYRFPDGTSPVDPTEAVPEDAKPRNSGEAVAQAREEVTFWSTKARAAEAELENLRIESAGELRNARAKVADVEEKLRRVEGDLIKSEKDRVAAIESARTADKSLASAIAEAQAKARAEVDTAKATAAAEVLKTKADADALLAEAAKEIERLTAENAALKPAAPPAAPAAPAKPPK